MVPSPLTTAQRSNFLPLTAWGYSWWRARSLSLLTGEAFSLEREQRLFLALCRPQAGERWLDAGTSTGFYAGVLAVQGCRVDAADLSAAMLQEAWKQQPSEQIRWQWVNLEASGWEGQQYDGITVGATLNETARPAVFLRELQRLLKPGGQLWLMFVTSSGGLGQRVLEAAGGLSFPELGWVERQLPECTVRTAFRVGDVQFAHLVKAGQMDDR